MQLVATESGADDHAAKRRRVELVPALEKELYPISSLRRKSGLLGPTMLIKGHASAVYCVDFSPDGRIMASGSNDKNIFIWNVYGECENTAVLAGHSSAVLELHFSADGEQLYTCSADKSCAVWAVEMGKRLKKLNGHTAIVNSAAPSRKGPPLLVSGGDDGTVKMWDLRARRCVHTFEHSYQILSVSFDGTGERIFAGTLDDGIMVFDLKEREHVLTLEGHTDSITGIDVSHDGNFLLSNSMDNSVRLWDIRPFCAGHRQLYQFKGPTHDAEKALHRVRFSPDDRFFTCGSADRQVYIFDTQGRQMLYRLPGHRGMVHEAVLHPKEPIVASASQDRTIFLGELD
jgi:Prp8 binding protein